jgi:hypothetical protein
MEIPFNRLMAGAIAVLVATVLFFGYAVREYANAECYAGLRAAGINRDLADIFDTVGEVVAGLRAGSSGASAWDNPHFQKDVEKAFETISAGRLALKKQKAIAALGAIDDAEEIVSRLKRIATTRVNDILKKQDPSDPEAFEKYRIEGKKLVEIARQLDSGLETLATRPKKLPGMCAW